MSLYVYRATLLRVVDGDSLHLRISLGLDVYLDAAIRLAGVNTPEMNSTDPVARAKAQEAKAFVIAYLPTEPNALTLKTFKDRREKYGRYLGEVAPAEAVQSVNTALIEAGLAAVYMA